MDHVTIGARRVVGGVVKGKGVRERPRAGPCPAIHRNRNNLDSDDSRKETEKWLDHP
jgi:hypothetical protein